MKPKTVGWVVGCLVYFAISYLTVATTGTLMGGTAVIFMLLGWAAGYATSTCLKHGEEDREKQRRHQEKNQYLSRSLTLLLNDSKAIAASLPEQIQSAETSLDVAEREFEEGTFAPFWDAVEEAANTLAGINAKINTVISNSSQYSTGTSQLDTPLPPFELGIRTLPDASHTAKRMRIIVRRAQKVFHFATIYEQRKTNRILVAGFSSLGQAINDLGDSLAASIERLGETVATEFQITRDQAARDSEARRDHERQEIEMLDNIQRRKKLPPKPGDKHC
ncbi:MAG: hypothetical protein NT167_11305 [Verrucomicrobia bacterium]|nr:hypothetical protein [Verrucomicrobiota bacterium]